jgi:hypothetical protein
MPDLRKRCHISNGQRVRVRKLSCNFKGCYHIAIFVGNSYRGRDVGVILLTVPLERSGFLSGMWLAVIRGALAALAFGLSAGVFVRGLNYRACP